MCIKAFTNAAKLIYLKKCRSPDRSVPGSPVRYRESYVKSSEPNRIMHTRELLLRFAFAMIGCGVFLISPLILFASGFLASIGLGIFTLCMGLLFYIGVILVGIIVISCLPCVGISLLLIQCRAWWHEWQRSRALTSSPPKVQREETEPAWLPPKNQASVRHRRNLSSSAKRKGVTWFDQINSN